MPTRNNALKFTALMIAMDLVASTSYLREEYYSDNTFTNSTTDSTHTGLTQKQTAAIAIASLTVGIMCCCFVCLSERRDREGFGDFLLGLFLAITFPIWGPFYLLFALISEHGDKIGLGLLVFFGALTSPLWGPFYSIYYCYNNPDEVQRNSASLGRLICDILSAPFVGCYTVASGCFTGCGESDAGRWLIENMAVVLGLFTLLGGCLSGTRKRIVDAFSFLCLCASASALETPLLNTTDPLSIPSSALKISDELLGEGSFGTVFKGSWRRKPGEGDDSSEIVGFLCYKAIVKTVAIKQLKLSSADVEEPFRQEVTMHASLEHANIVKLFGACFEPGRYSLVMEYMENGSLYKVLQEQKNLPWLTRLSIAKDVADGLAFLHSKYVIHCDLKSLNVVINLQMQAKISDFGFGKIKSDTTATMPTKVGMSGVGGTIPWMAQELFSFSAQHTEASDVYALAIIFWELCSQEQPYVGMDSNRIMALVANGQRLPVPSNAPADFSILISQSWAQQPSYRPKAAVIAVKLKDQHAVLFRGQNPGYVGGVPVDSAYGLNSQILI